MPLVRHEKSDTQSKEMPFFKQLIPVGTGLKFLFILNLV